MADEQRSATGPVGEALMRNLRRIREGQRLTYVELSKRMAATGRAIPVLGLRRIERGERRVDTDDLLALSHVLGVHPIDLLIPPDATDDEPYAITPEVSTTVATAREWVAGVGFLVPPRTTVELAEALKSMPEARAQAVANDWLRPEQRFGYFDRSNKIGVQEEQS